MTWGFGQLLAVIIVFLPFLSLLETWSGESRLSLLTTFRACWQIHLGELSRSEMAEQETSVQHQEELADQSIPVKASGRIATEPVELQRRQSF
jgi:hypothetical protein